MKNRPSYLEMHKNGALERRSRAALEKLSNCSTCPRLCAVNRLSGEKGMCLTGRWAKVSSHGPHFGEESPLVGHHGSGTVFFTHCNLLCNFCQNYDISHLGRGHEVTDEALGAIMLDLQNQGCHNINLVTPSHVVPQILSALNYAIDGGLNIPIVYNTGGYDALETLRWLDGIVDIYMPDLKFFSTRSAQAFCLPEDYGTVVRAAIKEMHRQVGDLVTTTAGIAVKGLIVRHLVMPHRLADTEDVMAFLANEISQNTYVNIMAQYHPCYMAHQVPELSGAITRDDFREAVEHARRNGLHRIDR
jgi:putative pyruvate formate lyase activating enzyme